MGCAARGAQGRAGEERAARGRAAAVGGGGRRWWERGGATPGEEEAGGRGRAAGRGCIGGSGLRGGRSRVMELIQSPGCLSAFLKKKTKKRREMGPPWGTPCLNYKVFMDKNYKCTKFFFLNHMRLHIYGWYYVQVTVPLGETRIRVKFRG